MFFRDLQKGQRTETFESFGTGGCRLWKNHHRNLIYVPGSGEWLSGSFNGTNGGFGYPAL